MNGILSSSIMNTNGMMARLPVDGVVPVIDGNWLADPEKVNAVKTLKDLILGNCRLLYGSERFKFYDIVIYEKEQARTFGALLTVNQNSCTKILREEVGNCPVKALRDMVQSLQKDTGILLTKYGEGSQLRGQQGYTNNETDKFELLSYKKDERLEGPDDDTNGLVTKYSDICDAIPKRHWVEMGPCKRPRMDPTDDGLIYDD